MTGQALFERGEDRLDVKDFGSVFDPRSRMSIIAAVKSGYLLPGRATAARVGDDEAST